MLPRVTGAPLIRPGVARHSGATLLLLPIEADNMQSFAIAAPVTGTCRPITLPGAMTLVELSPLPFAARRVLRRLPGLPTFYLGWEGVAQPPADDMLVQAGEVLATTPKAFAGLLFDDRMALSPVSWVELVAAAMTGVDSAAAVTAWRALTAFAGTERALRVLDHVGRPLAGERIRVASGAGSSTVTTGDDGSLPLPPGEVGLLWERDGARPVHALYERALAEQGDRNTSTRPGEQLAVPASVTRGHLQVLDAGRWFAARPEGLDPSLGHVRADSRLEPLVDGMDTLRLLLADLRAATEPGCGAHFAGWSFNDFPFDPADPDSMFTELVTGLRGGAGARFLMDKYLVFHDGAPLDDLHKAAIVLLVAVVDGVLLASIAEKVTTDERGYLATVTLGALAGLLAAALITPEFIIRKIEDLIDGSEELFETMQALVPGIALRARHPARFADNEIRTVINPFPIEPSSFIAGVGGWHQKFQVVRRSPDDLGNRVVGYLGGIDINQNRLDTPDTTAAPGRRRTRSPPRRHRPPSTTCTPGSPGRWPPTSRSPSNGAGASKPASSRPRPRHHPAGRGLHHAGAHEHDRRAAAGRPPPGPGLP